MAALVPVVPPMKASTIEYKALCILKEYCPEVLTREIPVPVDKIFELYIPTVTGMRTIYTGLAEYGVTNAEGYTNARQRISIVDQSLADDFSCVGRRRFRATVGHESGHCVLHTVLDRWQQSLHLVGCGMKRDRNFLRAFEDPEWQAWRFCLGLCMPEMPVRRMVDMYGCGYDGIQALMCRFDMNHTFVLSRLRSLKIDFPADSCSYQRGKNMPRNQNVPATWQSLKQKNNKPTANP